MRERPAVEQQDREALATALRAGKPDPGQEALRKHDQRIAEARRQTQALAIAVERSAHELAALVEANRVTWQTDVAKRLEQDDAEFLQAVEAMAAARRQRQAHRGLAAWLREFPAKNRYREQEPPVAGLPSHSGNETAFGKVYAALLAEATPETEPTGIEAVAK